MPTAECDAPIGTFDDISPHATPDPMVEIGDEVLVPRSRPAGWNHGEVVEVEHNPNNGRVYVQVDRGPGKLLEWWPIEKVRPMVGRG